MNLRIRVAQRHRRSIDPRSIEQTTNSLRMFRYRIQPADVHSHHHRRRIDGRDGGLDAYLKSVRPAAHSEQKWLVWF